VIAIETEATNTNVAPSREFLERQAFEAFKAFVLAFQRLIESPNAPNAPTALAQPNIPIAEPPTKDVMTADEVALFLGVDRNTVYDFASRGVIPHQRLGKRLLFRRGAVVAWLDTSLCNATPRRTA
jgi:excisionase family DNA binding protein